MHSWAEDAEEQLHVDVCYLWTHPEKATFFTAVKGEVVEIDGNYGVRITRLVYG